MPIRKPERAEPIVPAVAVPPPPPPKPKKTGAEKIADMQTGELNDILITEEGEIEDYAEYCSNLLEVTSFTQFSVNGWLKNSDTGRQHAICYSSLVVFYNSTQGPPSRPPD